MTPKPDDDVGWGITLVAALLVLGIAGVLTYLLIAFWPPDSSTATGTNVNIFGIRAQRPDAAVNLFLVVALAGAVGGAIHSVRSLYWYVGNRNFKYSWLLMYFSLPVIGAMLAVVTYLVIRGGLTGTVSSTEDVNVYGLVAVAALVGLFSREAAEKLRAVFETLLTPAEKGQDPAIELSIEDVDPSSGPIGSDVRLKGSGLASATSISIGGGSTKSFTRVSDTVLDFKVPLGATDGVVIVTSPAGTVASNQTFTVTS